MRHMVGLLRGEAEGGGRLCRQVAVVIHAAVELAHAAPGIVGLAAYLHAVDVGEDLAVFAFGLKIPVSPRNAGLLQFFDADLRQTRG